MSDRNQDDEEERESGAGDTPAGPGDEDAPAGPGDEDVPVRSGDGGASSGDEEAPVSSGDEEAPARSGDGGASSGDEEASAGSGDDDATERPKPRKKKRRKKKRGAGGGDERSARSEEREKGGAKRRAGTKRRGKKGKPKAPVDDPELRPSMDADGNERPRFLLSFPHDPDLDRLVAAFERGDYWTVRQQASALAESADDDRVRDAALELLRRIEPAPLAKYLLGAAVTLLLFLILWTYFGAHDH